MSVLLREATRRSAAPVTLRLRLGSARATEAPFIDFEVLGGPQTFAEELADLLSEVFQVERDAADVRRLRHRRSVVVPAAPVAGFVIGGALPRVSEARPATGRGTARAYGEWLRVAQRHPGLQLSLDFRAVDPKRIEVAVSVAGVPEFPLAATAIVRELFPDAVLAPPTSRATVAGPDEVVAELLSLPLGEEQLPGFPQAPSPGIAVLPSSTPIASGIRLGVAPLASGRRVDVVLGFDEAVKHIHTFGATGVGKTTLLRTIARGFADHGCLVLDVTGRMVRQIVAELPREALERTWYIRAGDVEHPVRINPLRIEDPVRRAIVVQDLVQMFYQIFDRKREGIVGPRFERMFSGAILGVIELLGPRASLLDVPRAFTDRRVEGLLAELVRDALTVDFWQGEMRQTSDHARSETVGWFTSKFQRFAANPALEAILGSGEDAFDPATAMDDGRIILVDLSKDEIGEVGAQMLGFLYLMRFWNGFLTRSSDRPFGIIVDEAQNFAAGSLPSMLSEGRKYGAAVTIAHQYAGQLEGDLLTALQGNVATTIAFRSSPDDAVGFSRRTGDAVAAAAVAGQPDLHAILLRSGGVQRRPHTLIVEGRPGARRRSPAAADELVSRVAERTRSELVAPFATGRRGTLLDELERVAALRRPAAAPSPADSVADADFDRMIRRMRARRGETGADTRAADEAGDGAPLTGTE